MIEVKAYSGLMRNYRDLAAQLGVDVSEGTRREREQKVLAAAWQAWGDDMCSRINGQFGFALYNTETNDLFCARDRLGAELLFYYETASGEVLVSTQIKDLFDQPGFVREVNRRMVQFFISFTYVPGEETLFKGVFKLEPGGYLHFNDAGLKLGRYWELAFAPDESKTLEEWADELSDAMDASLRDIGDEGVTPDSFLSGGVDSSYILAKSNAKCGYCAAYENQDASEEQDARATARWLGRDFEGLVVTPEDFFGNLDDFIIDYEQPSGDVAGLALYCACKKMVGKSKMCFSGEGADEFFAGYSVYKTMNRYRKVPGMRYYGTTFLLSNNEQKRYLKHYYKDHSTSDFIKERSAGAKKLDPLASMLYIDMRTYFEGSILFNSTRIARGTGLDIRMPYCDQRIFDIARRMPSRFKLSDQGNKLALRAAASRVLPDEVAYRRKLGFPVPIRSWMKEPAIKTAFRRAFESEAAAEFFDLDEIGGLLDAFLGEKTGKSTHPVWYARRKLLLWRLVWTIYVFIRWYELFFCEQDAAE